MLKESFEPIPSLDYRYEINQHGAVRNAKTRRVLKASCGHIVAYINGERVSRGLKSLLHEVHGILPDRTQCTPIPVTVRKGCEAYTFGTMKAAANFLARRLHFSAGRIAVNFWKRWNEIDGWKITYHEPERRIFKLHYANHRVKRRDF